MAETSLTRGSGFAGLAIRGRYGRVIGDKPAVLITERIDLRIVQIAAFGGKEHAFEEVVRSIAGIEPPKTPHLVAGEDLSLIGIAPSHWLAVAGGETGGLLLTRLDAALSGLATFVDQSDAKAMLRLSGPKARDVLAKGCMLDLDARAFRPGDAATTQVALIPCQIWLVDAAPSFELAVPLSYARSFWSWLAASAADYGYEVAPPLAG